MYASLGDRYLDERLEPVLDSCSLMFDVVSILRFGLCSEMTSFGLDVPSQKGGALQSRLGDTGARCERTTARVSRVARKIYEKAQLAWTNRAISALIYAVCYFAQLCTTLHNSAQLWTNSKLQAFATTLHFAHLCTHFAQELMLSNQC
jgi:hypothetical protein